jgi:ATP-binding cassette subfamily B protein
MGATGAGKTALVNLIARAHDASAGSVRVFGRDVKDWPLEALRDCVSVASQQTQLFRAGVAQNIEWGRPGAQAAEIEQAARVAQAHDFIARMPQGYDSVLGQQGVNLSGGQRQRVALARAVLKDAPILVIDDATSALDLKTEADFYAALEACKPALTKIIVAQRIASVRRADKIVLLDGGRVAGVGTHLELLAENALYQEIYESQFGKQKEAANASA